MMAAMSHKDPHLIIQVMPKLAFGSFGARWIVSTTHAHSWHSADFLAWTGTRKVLTYSLPVYLAQKLQVYGSRLDSPRLASTLGRFKQILTARNVTASLLHGQTDLDQVQERCGFLWCPEQGDIVSTGAPSDRQPKE